MSFESIQVKYEYTDDLNTTIKWLNSIPSLAAYDFEVANRHTLKEKEEMKYTFDNDNTLSKEEKRILKQRIYADGLSHPSLTIVTHLSVAWSDRKAIVFITLNDKVRNTIFDYLISTNNTQLWHKCLFDFKHINYHTYNIPKNYKDTQLMTKTLINNADPFKSHTGLKKLQAKRFGLWAEIRDASFVIEDAYLESMLLYAATDVCAGWCQYHDILKEIDKWRI